METRKLTIVATREQKKYVINSAATTLGELKADLRSNGIDYTDMTFMEGLTRTELKDDASILPHDVVRTDRTTGEETVTNELVFMLTNTAKKIRSGAIAMTRPQVYAAIKTNNLQDAVKKTFGKNFTQCSTEDLISIVNKNVKKQTPKTEAKAKEAPVATPVAPVAPAAPAPCDKRVENALRKLVDILYDNDTLDSYEVEEVLNILDGNGSSKCVADNSVKEEMPYSDTEIDDMFRGL